MIALINTGVANISSVAFALDRLNRPYIITADAQIIEQSSHVILPGVGHAKALMQGLAKLQLIETIQRLRQPVLGICLGMQVLYDHSAEGDIACLGIIPGHIEAIQNYGLSLPHMGWNTLQFIEPSSALFQGVTEFSPVYFVHSFRATMSPDTRAFSHYGEDIPAMVSRHNFYGTQFHPERSGPVGQQILRNFIEL